MARTARGADSLESARQMLAGAQTAEQLRQAQAVVLPLDYGLSLSKPRRSSAAPRRGPAACAIASWPARLQVTASAPRAAAGATRT